MDHRTGRIAAALIAAAAATGAVLANDSVAETAAGGLVLKRSGDIDMVSEDLYVSAEQIRVRYVFRNRAPQDVTVTVAFPMPVRDFGELRHSDGAWPTGFVTRVDGRPVAMRVERRATVGGVDQSALLARLGIPLVADDIFTALDEAFARLPREQQDQLVDAGAVEAIDYGEGLARHFMPLWTVSETWYWEQLFPAGRNVVVEHSYTPGAGGSVGTTLAFPDLRDSPEVRAFMAEYCVDRAFLAAVDRMNARVPSGQVNLLGEQRVRYILTTGGNWRSPIGEFRLVVDKGRPDNIVSFCGSGVRRISPTQFEMRRRNWRPDRDLAVLIVQPHRDE